MIKSPRLKEEKIIKHIRNLFRLKKNKMTLQLKTQEIFLDQKKIKRSNDIALRKILRAF